MILSHVHQLLVAANRQPNGFLQVRSVPGMRQVRLMQEAGLVQATLSDGSHASFSSINRLTASGRSFLRTFQRPLAAPRLLARSTIVSDTDWRAASSAAVVEKWAIKFTLDLRVPKRPLA